MKRIFSTLCLALLSLTALADEGMWLPSLISSRIDDMRAKGFQLTAEDIYSINKASLKDAVMLFDDGCTAELISPEGLLITNHHCGYGAIQRLSSVEHDYLTDGFWAQSREEELPNENLNVKFLKTHGGHHRASGRRREPRGNPRKKPARTAATKPRSSRCTTATNSSCSSTSSSTMSAW